MKQEIEKSVSGEAVSRNFIWYATRISFWVMALLWVIIAVLPEHQGLWISDWIFIVSIPFTFVTSIIHLVKYKEKAFAITSLVISSLGLLFVLIGMIAGVMSVLGGIN